MLKRIIDHPWFIWGLLAIPSVPMVAALASGQLGPEGQPATKFLLHPTGEFSARFMIISMVLTPLRMLFPGNKFWRWMMRRRRYFGLAAFAYAALHTVLYVIDMGNLNAILVDALQLGIWTGWAAMFIFIPLAVTSNDYATRRLGPIWKSLQQFVYAAAFGTILHWIFVNNTLGPALVHFAPLAILTAYRIWKMTPAQSPSA